MNTTNNTKFKGLTLDNTLNLKTHSDLTLLKLNTAFCTIRVLKHTFTQDTLIMIYFAYFHSILNYCITFWGISRYSNKILILKRITGLVNQVSCHEVLRDLHILKIATHTHARTHARARARAHTHTHTHIYYVYCSVYHNIFYEITNRCSYMQSIVFHC